MSGADLARYPNLWKRRNRYYVRVRVPADLRGVEKREHIAVSLGTSEHADAVRRYRDVHGQIEREFEVLRAQLAGRDAITAALNDGRLEALSDSEVETLVREWFDNRERFRRPLVPLGEEVEALADLRDDEARLDEVDPAKADVAHSFADRLLLEAGTPVQRRRFGSDLPVVDRFGRQYRYLVELVGRALKAEHVLAQRHVLGRPVGEIEPMFDPGSRAVAPPQGREAPRNVALLISRYRADREQAHGRESTDRKYHHIFRALEEALGPEKLVCDIKRDDCRRVRDLLRALPKNASKFYPKKSLTEAVELGKRDNRPGLAPNTVASYLNNLSALFNWAVAEEWIDRNPAKGLVEKGPPQVRRRGFHPLELETVFKGLAPMKVVQPERFWVPALALFTGARAGELCQLRVADVIKEQGVWCLDLSEFDEEGRRVETKSLKTAESERLVPLHPDLMKAGFLKYVRGCAAAGQKRLFPSLRLSSKGNYSHEFSKWFGRFLDTVGLNQPALVLHSFRHGFRNACRSANIAEETARALGGWAAINQAARYGDRGMVPVLNRAVRKLRYGDFKLPELGR